MRDIDKAIELLKPLAERYCWNDKWAGSQMEKALVLLKSAKAEPGEFSSCGTVKGLLDQLGRHRHLFDQMVAEKQAQAERIEKLETFLTNLKDCASAGDITLIEQVLEGDET